MFNAPADTIVVIDTDAVAPGEAPSVAAEMQAIGFDLDRSLSSVLGDDIWRLPQGTLMPPIRRRWWLDCLRVLSPDGRAPIPFPPPQDFERRDAAMAMSAFDAMMDSIPVLAPVRFGVETSAAAAYLSDVVGDAGRAFATTFRFAMRGLLDGWSEDCGTAIRRGATEGIFAAPAVATTSPKVVDDWMRRLSAEGLSSAVAGSPEYMRAAALPKHLGIVGVDTGAPSFGRWLSSVPPRPRFGEVEAWLGGRMPRRGAGLPSDAKEAAAAMRLFAADCKIGRS